MADDLVSEAFTKVLAALPEDHGPHSAFRAYLLTALRHTASDKTRRDSKVDLADDFTTATGVTLAAIRVCHSAGCSFSFFRELSSVFPLWPPSQGLGTCPASSNS